MVLLSRVEDRKAVLGLFNAAHEMVHNHRWVCLCRLLMDWWMGHCYFQQLFVSAYIDYCYMLMPPGYIYMVEIIVWLHQNLLVNRIYRTALLYATQEHLAVYCKILPLKIRLKIF
jgi:hypothetical protein